MTALASVRADQVHAVPAQRRRVALGIVVLLVLAVAALVWFTL